MNGKRKKHQSIKALKAQQQSEAANAGPSEVPVSVTPVEGTELVEAEQIVTATVEVPVATVDGVVATAETVEASTAVVEAVEATDADASAKQKRSRARGGTTPRWSEDEEQQVRHADERE